MAIRAIRQVGDEVLTKMCKPVRYMTPRIATLIEDMFDTMYESQGVGLAAPQVGVLKRLMIIDIFDGVEEDGEATSNPYVFINPEIITMEEQQTGDEGCLSLPGKYGIVTRPQKVVVRALDFNMDPFELEAEGLMARAICHEIDHLDGKLYMELAVDGIKDVPTLEEQEAMHQEGHHPEEDM